MKWFYAYEPFFFPLTLLAVVLIFMLCTRPVPKPPEPPGAGPSIYITRTDHAMTLEGETLWILEYTVDGAWQSPAFHSQEAMTRYVEYLGTIGEVYRGEGEGNAD
jgi:hypothetical protein